MFCVMSQIIDTFLFFENDYMHLKSLWLSAKLKKKMALKFQYRQAVFKYGSKPQKKTGNIVLIDNSRTTWIT